MHILCFLIFLIPFVPFHAFSSEMDCNNFTLREAMHMGESPETAGYEKLVIIKPVDSEKEIWVKKEILLNGSAIKRASIGHSNPFFTHEQMEQIKSQQFVPEEKEKTFTESSPLINIEYKNFKSIEKLTNLKSGSRVAYVYKNKVITAATLLGQASSLEESIFSALSEAETKELVEIINSFSTCK